MSGSGKSTDSSRRDRALRERVLAPIESAASRVAREQREVAREVEAFDSFRARVREVTLDAGDSRGRTLSTDTSDAAAEIRTAYRETAVALDHYDEEFGEPPAESMAEEFGPEVGAILHPDSGQPLAEFHRSAVVEAAGRTIRRRKQILAWIEREQDSLEGAGEELTALLDSPRGTDECADATVEDRLRTLGHDRQQFLQEQLPRARFDKHEFHSYLYHDEPWTYPVLTAVARFVDALGPV